MDKKQIEIAKDALLKIRRFLAINQFPPKSREAYFVAKDALQKIDNIESKGLTNENI